MSNSNQNIFLTTLNNGNELLTFLKQGLLIYKISVNRKENK